MISERTIQQVRDLNIESVLKPYVKLTRRGNSLVGLCPFHSERTPSFSVSPGKNLYHCFGCNRGGDAIGFVMEKENLHFIKAVEKIARDNGIAIEYTGKEQAEEEKAAYRHKESLLAVNEMAHKYFVDCFRLDMSDEGRSAREYTYGRWSEELCADSGIGYAPKNGNVFIEYCQKNAVPMDLLIETGLIKKDDTGITYAFFRERVMIPIRNRWGRIIAFTGRHIGSGTKNAKYLNSPTSEIYDKGASLFGIDRASRQKSPDVIIVEGAPDVLRLQGLGIENVVASLGTAWSDAQFEHLKKIAKAICFIPDSDVAEGKLFGPGFEAVMKNGSTAMMKGFDVSVRELPFAEVPMSDEELRELYPGRDELPPDAPRIKPGKNDPDSYIRSKEDFATLPERYFVVWLAEKRFFEADSLVKQRAAVSEIAKLLTHINDQLVVEECIEQLSKIHGRTKFWRDAVSQARGENRRKKDSVSTLDERQREVDALRQAGLFVRDNCYYTIGDEEEDPVMISNFIMEPLFHIGDDNNGTRIFRLKNEVGDRRLLEIKESEMCSLNAFQQKVGTLGNFIWLAKIDRLNRVKRYLYAKTDTAERIRKLGWDSVNDLYAFGNGIMSEGVFLPVDDMGIVRSSNGKAFYIPATSKIYRNNPEIYQFERLMVHENHAGVSMKVFAEKLIAVFGENARIALCYLFATVFRDIVFRRTRHFPILNLFGEKGTGKTTLATSLQSFFIHGIDPPNLGVTSVPAMNDRVSQAVNTLVVFDEYKNDLDIRKIAYLKGLWGGGGQTKKNTNTDGMAAQTIVSTGIALCGQDKPTIDMALYTRVLFLAFTRTSFNQTERMRYEDLVTLCNMGLTHLTVELLKHRSLFEKNFSEAYAMSKRELAAKLSKVTVHERIFGNWVIPLATYRSLETVMDLPFSYNELFETAVKGVLNQNELAQESSEVGDFWNMLQGFQTAGKCVEGVHYNIRYLRRFRPLSVSEDIEFAEARPVLYLNAAALSPLFSGRGSNATSARSYWSTIMSYLKSHNSYLGLKQDRFSILLPNGEIDYSVETINGQPIRRKKTNRPKALCFDYLMLKDAFGIDLETEISVDEDNS